MFFVKKLDVADNEKAFLFKKNRFAAVLGPESYRYFDLPGYIRLEKFDITQYELNHNLNKFLVSTFSGQTRNHLEEYQLNDKEVGLLYRDNRLVEIVAPGSFKVYWKGPEKIELKRIDISEDFRIPEALLALLGPGQKQIPSSQDISYTEVEDNHIGLLLVNGKLEQTLEPGSYGFWKYQRNVVVKHIDLRLQNLEITGQEILSKDRVSLRLNLSSAYRVDDPQLAQSKLTDFSDFLYREFQLQLREAVGTRTLDQILNDKDSLNQVISEGVRQRVAAFGISVNSVGVRDIILPGDMKTILNRVVEAEKSAEANLIKRREETAATRSLHNTAKMIEGNPTLMRLKELETLEKVTEKIGNINVYSGLEGVMRDLVKSPSGLRV
ncbi:MAG: slipin family protein [Gammaproteobacteria bacterium]|nr:slipin family protein [Gammaproteobacteria bacterium]